MPITRTLVADWAADGFGVTNGQISGDWFVGSSNTGSRLYRVDLTTGTVYVTSPWFSGTQSMSSGCVRPNGNVCLFRGNGDVYEVDPVTGTTTPWSAGGSLGLEGYSPAATVGDWAYFGGYGIANGSSTGYATRLNLNTRVRQVIGPTGTGIASWYGFSVLCPTGTAVWLFKSGAFNTPPWRIDLSTLAMTQPFADQPTLNSDARPFVLNGKIYFNESGFATRLWVLDPVAMTFGYVTGPSQIKDAVQLPSGSGAGSLAFTASGFGSFSFFHYYPPAATSWGIGVSGYGGIQMFRRSASNPTRVYVQTQSATGSAGLRVERLDWLDDPIEECEELTLTPYTAMAAGSTNVFSFSPLLDGFGTNRTPTGWPTEGLVQAIEATVTNTTAYTADGQVQAVIARPDSLNRVAGSAYAASGLWSGWGGSTATYRTSASDAYYLNRVGGWVTIRIDLDVPTDVENMRFILDTQVGALRLDSVTLFGYCLRSGIYRDGRVHLS